MSRFLDFLFGNARLVFVSVILLGVIAYTVQRCHTEKGAKETALARVDSLRTVVLFERGEKFRWKGLADACQSRANEALLKVAALTSKLQGLVTTTGGRVDAMPRRQQQVVARKELVATGAISASRLADTTGLNGGNYLTDAELDAGFAKATLWLGIYKRQADSLATVASVAVGQVDKEKARADRSEASSRYAEDQFLQEAETKRFLGVGRKPAMRKRARAVRAVREGRAEVSSVNAETVSPLETELNKP